MLKCVQVVSIRQIQACLTSSCDNEKKEDSETARQMSCMLQVRLFFLFFFSSSFLPAIFLGADGGQVTTASPPHETTRTPTCQISQPRGKKHSGSVVKSRFKIAVQYLSIICMCVRSMLYLCIMYCTIRMHTPPVA